MLSNNSMDRDSEYHAQSTMDIKLLTLCICNFCFHSGFSVIFSIYPLMANQEVGLDFSQIGMVFAANPIGAVIMSFFVGQQIQGWGRKRCLILSQIAQIVSLVMFSCLPMLVDQPHKFYLLSLSSRFIQGLSGSIYLTTSYSYVPIFWEDKVEQKLGFIETISAFSVLSAPSIGAIFNKYIGFSAPFLLLSVAITCGICATHIYIPGDSKLGVVPPNSNKQASLTKALQSPKILATLVAIILVMTASAFMSTFYVVHMYSFGINQLTSSIFQTSNTIGYMFGLQVVARLPQQFDRAFKISIGIIFSGVGTLIMAPFWTSSPNSAASLIVGQLLVGTIQSFAFLPSIPYMNNILTQVYNDPELQTQLQDISSSLFVLAGFMGIFFSNIVGGNLYDFYGGLDIHKFNQEKQAFHDTSLTIGFIIFMGLVIFMIYGGGFKGWENTIQRQLIRKQSQTEPLSLELNFLQHFDQFDDPQLQKRSRSFKETLIEII